MTCTPGAARSGESEVRPFLRRARFGGGANQARKLRSGAVGQRPIWWNLYDLPEKQTQTAVLFRRGQRVSSVCSRVTCFGASRLEIRGGNYCDGWSTAERPRLVSTAFSLVARESSLTPTSTLEVRAPGFTQPCLVKNQRKGTEKRFGAIWAFPFLYLVESTVVRF